MPIWHLYGGRRTGSCLAPVFWLHPSAARLWPKGASEAEAMLAGLNVVLSVKSSAASSANWRRLSVCFRATPRASSQGRRPQPKCRPRRLRRLLQHDPVGAGAPRPQNPLAAGARRRPSMIGSLFWQRARRSRKSPQRARGLARTTSAPHCPAQARWPHRRARWEARAKRYALWRLRREPCNGTMSSRPSAGPG